MFLRIKSKKNAILPLNNLLLNINLVTNHFNSHIDATQAEIYC